MEVLTIIYGILHLIEITAIAIIYRVSGRLADEQLEMILDMMEMSVQNQTDSQTDGDK